ncbi:MAG: F0F1 ATP synthase subunit delta [Candidatus Gracilibacteria bacterium]|jgi:F0F1-type ATP synthase delta subunit
MLNSLLTALLYEVLGFASHHPDFLTLEAGQREELLADFKMPTALKHYLAHTNEKHFMQDLRLLLSMLTGTSQNSLSIKGNLFFKAVLEFLSTTFAGKLDELPNKFYLLPAVKRMEEVEKLIESDSLIARALKDLLANNSYQEIASFLEQFSKAVTDSDMVLVQMPRDIEPALKKEIREALSEKYPLSFPKFQVNRELIGGLRVFVNGKTKDLSWFARINKITSIKISS